MWKRQEVLYAPQGHKVVHHPIAGTLVFEYLAFQALDSLDLQVIINTPANGSETSEKLKWLLEYGD